MGTMGVSLPSPIYLLGEPYPTNRTNDTLPTERVKVSLVNLVAGGRFAEKIQPAAGVLVLAGYLRATTRAQVAIIDMQKHLSDLEREGLTTDERFNLALRMTIEDLKSHPSHIVGLSMKWGTLEPAEAMVAALRADPQLNQTLVVTGNSLSTFGSKELLSRSIFQGAIAVLGEGEDALRRIVETASQNLTAYSDPSLYRGIPNVKTEPVEDGKIARENMDLDAYPLLTEDSVPEMFHAIPWVQLEASRGCPWGHCTFCSIRNLYASFAWRPFPLALVLDRIERHIRSGHFPSNWFGFADSEALGIGGRMSDEIFEARIRRAHTFAEGLRRLNEHYAHYLGGSFSFGRFSVSTDGIYKDGEEQRNREREKILEEFHAAGLQEVYWGSESGNTAQLKRYAKRTTVKENRQARKILGRVRINYSPGFIFFDPEATPETLRDNARFVTAILNQDVFGSLRAQAGSPIVKRLRNTGFLGDFNLAEVSYEIRWEKAHPEVKLIREVFIRFEDLTKQLVNYLHYAADDSATLERWGSFFTDTNGTFLHSYILISDPREREDWLKTQLLKIKSLLQQLTQQVTQGTINDPSHRLRDELLPEALAKNEAWLAGLG